MDIYELTALYTATFAGFLLLFWLVIICCLLLSHEPKPCLYDLEH